MPPPSPPAKKREKIAYLYSLSEKLKIMLMQILQGKQSVFWVICKWGIEGESINIPHGSRLSTVTFKSARQACRLMWHSLRSCTSSDAQIGLRMMGHGGGHIHSAVLFTTRQPILYGALQPSVRQGSEKRKKNRKDEDRVNQIWNHIVFKALTKKMYLES